MGNSDLSAPGQKSGPNGFSVRMPPAQRKALEERALAEGKEKSTLLREIVADYCAPKTPQPSALEVTLQGINQQLTHIEARLGVIERRPALRAEPGQFAWELATAVEHASSRATEGVRSTVDRLKEVTSELRTVIGVPREQAEQKRQVWKAATWGAAVGLAMAVPLAMVLPF